MVTRDELQALFLLTARAWGIPQPEERIQEAAAELEELMGHLAVIMDYPLPVDVEPAPELSLMEPVLEVSRKEWEPEPGEEGGGVCDGRGGS